MMMLGEKLEIFSNACINYVSNAFGEKYRKRIYVNSLSDSRKLIPSYYHCNVFYIVNIKNKSHYKSSPFQLNPKESVFTISQA